ncbi:hypothetical protein SAMN05421736_105219 [Evansella caseinilytica]|uniref:Uncharacterized protein n=1 Tax=Evansella caseinilytica TaxID=1503961 RepID=A0A1H3PU50_9BACI|nr:hypothetical protein [Evansella caseinilytica]SDZ04832.1 hypothetical protein SAMN05421736_105219 [Evansella caseinilytica]
MLRIQDILNSYGFKQGKWMVNGELLDTEKGKKRLVLWPEEKLARWHIQWRDRLAKTTGCLTNRMIQTVNGEKMLVTDSGWITLHDEVTSLFSYQNKEKEAGKFFGKYYSVEMDDFELEVAEPVFKDEKLQYLKLPIKQSMFFEKLRREALLRFSKAQRIKAELNNVSIPVVAPIRSLDQGKLVFEKMYWLNGNTKPERGYGPLKTVFSEWLHRYGRASFFFMLDELDPHFSLKTDSGQQLLADCLLPWEFVDYMEKATQVKDREEEASLKEQLIFQWELSRELVEALSQWLDVSREKVSV